MYATKEDEVKIKIFGHRVDNVYHTSSSEEGG